ncbi:hypothetical protein [Rhizobium binae]|uniref:hypothetical protein n=1 Tax=Rhizobium binae TaxID=1138190 RepID=UPI001C82BE1C|nr:hypothetical protein [Rhizobium binae]MBX4941134.1 hypothetical protein [Rhizobium binae]
MSEANDNLVQVKTCTKCGEEKLVTDFPRHSGHRDGFGSQCKACKRVADSEYRARNPEKNKEEYRRRIEANPNYHAELYAKDPEKAKATVAKWQKDNPEKRREIHKRFRESNPEYYKEWPKRNPEKTKERRRKQYEKKISTPRGKLENSVKVGVHRGLTNGSKAGRSTFSLLGYTSDDLREHLEKLFLPGMTWENYGDWHVDHKIPKSAFNYETPDDIDFKRCWALSNLQPLWAVDNIRKNARLDAPFQPSLAIKA